MKFKILLLVVASLIHQNTFALGGVDGGGGKSIVCRNIDGTIKSTEILDLFEGRARYGLSYTEKSEPYLQQIENLLKSSGLDPANSLWASWVLYRVRYVASKMRIMPDGVQLLPVDDSHEVIAPRGCQTEQAVNYVNDQQILFDGEIWKALSETQKAALIFHEGIYREIRDSFLPEKNSIRARHYNAFLFSGQKSENLSPRFGTSSLHCSGYSSDGKYTNFVAYPSVKRGEAPTFYFLAYHGRMILSESKLENYTTYPEVNPLEIWSNLKNPSQRMTLSGSTESTFEQGDRVNLSIWKRDDEQNYTIHLYGKSSLTDEEFDTVIECQ